MFVLMVMTHIDHYTKSQIIDNERTRSHMQCKIIVQECHQWTVLQYTIDIDLDVLLSSVEYSLAIPWLHDTWKNNNWC